MQIIEEDDEGLICWLGEEPDQHGVGIKAIIDFPGTSVTLTEEDSKGEEHSSVYIGFDELDELQELTKKQRG